MTDSRKIKLMFYQIFDVNLDFEVLQSSPFKGLLKTSRINSLISNVSKSSRINSNIINLLIYEA